MTALSGRRERRTMMLDAILERAIITLYLEEKTPLQIAEILCPVAKPGLAPRLANEVRSVIESYEIHGHPAWDNA